MAGRSKFIVPPRCPFKCLLSYVGSSTVSLCVLTLLELEQKYCPPIQQCWTSRATSGSQSCRSVPHGWRQAAAQHPSLHNNPEVTPAHLYLHCHLLSNSEMANPSKAQPCFNPVTDRSIFPSAVLKPRCSEHWDLSSRSPLNK